MLYFIFRVNCECCECTSNGLWQTHSYLKLCETFADGSCAFGVHNIGCRTLIMTYTQCDFSPLFRWHCWHGPLDLIQKKIVWLQSILISVNSLSNKRIEEKQWRRCEHSTVQRLNLSPKCVRTYFFWLMTFVM